MATPRFDEIVDRLYAEPPANFVATRDAAAKQARESGDKDLASRLKALRRPTAAAALVNLLVRSAADPGIPQLLDLGARLRDAQSSLDGPAMKSLGAERNRLVAGLLDSVAELTDEDLTGGVRDQLISTFTAAIADPEAETAVSSGRLVNAISYSGFGEVDVSDAVATPLPDRPRPQVTPAQTADAASGAAEVIEAVDEGAAERAAAANRMLERAQRALQEAKDAEASALAALDLAERTLTAARHTHDSAGRRAKQATTTREAAEQAVADAQAVLGTT
ncbi:hypothetical protein [Flexivirga meconopsidis]|uniref:hypothetical protein n=1 Tax=Flexivirga meconopsidis TaxID=2977121 RepID=UPI00223F617B|nr:hypothetical protein [Flexivirga meconopsidis]